MEDISPLLSATAAEQHPSTYRLLAYCIFAVALYFSVLWAYRVTLHPLAKYPGPFLYKLSDWPLVIQAYYGNRHLHHLTDHKEHGPIVRIGPHSLSFNTETALNIIYGSKIVNVRKSEFYKTLDAGAGALSTHTEIAKDKHAIRRRVLSHAFSDKALRSAEPFILNNVNKWCDLLGPQTKGDWSDKRNMADWSNWLAYDIMGDLAFGRRFHCLESEEHRYISTALTEGSKFLYWFSYLPFVRLLRPFMNTKLMQWLGGRTVRDNVYLVNYACEQLRLKIKAEEAAGKEGREMRKDFMHYLLASRDPKTGTRLTQAELQADSVLLIGAGADTIATSIAAAFFYLLRNPSSLIKATTEVRTTFATASEIHSGPELNSCVYLQACLEETLRCAPPVTSHLPREVLPGGLYIDGHHIPAGIVVGVSSYSIHHNPQYYPDPWSFRPERWIVDEKTSISLESTERARRAFCPFSLGTRGCIGKSFAYQEFKLALASVLFRYDIREAAGMSLGGGRQDLGEGRHRYDEYQLRDYFAAERDGPLVEFKFAGAQ